MNVLGIFAKRPQPGRVKTRLAADIGDEPAAELYSAFLADLIARFRHAGDRRVLAYTPGDSCTADYFRHLCTEDYELWPQPDGDLGGRISAFFAGCFHRGATRVVLIGSDSPTLPPEHVASAFDRLEDQDCVLGPSCDGGYYLIGLRQPQERLFAGIDWGSALVLQQTTQRIASAGLRLEVLPVWYDVDSRCDLQFLHGHLQALQISGISSAAPKTEAFLKGHTGANRGEL